MISCSGASSLAVSRLVPSRPSEAPAPSVQRTPERQVRSPVDYTDPSGDDDGSAVQDLAGNDAASFTGRTVPAGDYMLSATAYPKDDAEGEALQTLNVSFTVPASVVTAGTALSGLTLTSKSGGTSQAIGDAT